MLNFDSWLTGNSFAPTPESRAVDAWNRINEKPAQITIFRNAAQQSAQTVRIEANSELREPTGDTGMSAIRQIIIFGIKDHPTEDDTDIQRSDRFRHDEVDYRVVDVIYPLGEIQARAEAVV